MTALRHHLRPLTWIALVAVLALALLPTLAHARAHALMQGAGGWAEVCTSVGPKRIAVDADGKLVDAVVDTTAAGPSWSAGHLQHCPLCAPGLDAPVLPPPSASAALAPAVVAACLPAAFLHAPRTLHAWRSTQPRGPPAAA